MSKVWKYIYIYNGIRTSPIENRHSRKVCQHPHITAWSFLVLHKFRKWILLALFSHVRKGCDEPGDDLTPAVLCQGSVPLQCSVSDCFDKAQKDQLLCGVCFLMSDAGLETEACWLTHWSRRMLTSKQTETEEISRGIESTNSCQPSLHYTMGSAAARTTECEWEGTDGHAPFGWQTAQPWERCGTDSFLSRNMLDTVEACCKITSGRPKRVS